MLGLDEADGQCLGVAPEGEDDENVRVTVVEGGAFTSLVVNGNNANNPSGRRDGVAVAFTCEGCNADLELTLAQHKGETFVQWRWNEPSSV